VPADGRSSRSAILEINFDYGSRKENRHSNYVEAGAATTSHFGTISAVKLGRALKRELEVTKGKIGQEWLGQDRRGQDRRGQQRRVQERRGQDRRQAGRWPRLLPTTTGFLARLAVAALRKHDIDPAPLLQRVGLSERDLNERENCISSAAQARLLEFAAEALHDPALGFHLATEVNPRELGLVFYLASAAKNLGEAIALLARYCKVVNEAIRVQMTRGSGDLAIEVHVVGVPRFLAAQYAELAIAFILKSLRVITGRNVHPTQITIVHTRRSGVREFERFCGCPVEFGGSTDQLVFSNESLAVPLIGEDLFLLDVLRPICDEAAKQRETAPGSLRALVENEAQKLLPHGRAQRQIVARKLAMSTRTLARRLASEGTTFEEVVDELRRSLALQYVKTPNVSLSHVAWLLGYEGATSFNHAFRRWTGGSPSASRVQSLLLAPA
jgi:AraC-like DNA-binding protein